MTQGIKFFLGTYSTFPDACASNFFPNHPNRNLPSSFPTGLLNLQLRNKFTNKNVTFMWYSNDVFHYVFKAEFATLVSLKVPSGSPPCQLACRSTDANPDARTIFLAVDPAPVQRPVSFRSSFLSRILSGRGEKKEKQEKKKRTTMELGWVIASREISPRHHPTGWPVRAVINCYLSCQFT